MSEEKLTTKGLLSKVLDFLKPYLGLLFISIIVSVIHSILKALPIPLFKLVTDLLFEGEIQMPAGGEGFLEELKQNLTTFTLDLLQAPTKIETLENLSIMLILIYIIQNSFRFVMFWMHEFIQQSVIRDIRDKLFASLSSLSLDYFNKNRQGNLISIMTNDVEVFNNNIVNQTTIIIRDVISISIYLYILIDISSYLLLISLSTSVFTFGILAFARKYLKRYGKRMQLAMADFTSTLQETISGIKVLQAYNSVDKANEKFSRDTNRFKSSAVKNRKIMTLVPALNEVFAILALSIVLITGGRMVFEDTITSSELIIFLLTLFSIMRPLNAIMSSVTKFQRGFVAGNRIFDVMNVKPTITSGNTPINAFSSSISIQNLSFAYEEANVLDNISIDIKKGETVAFVGASGSGKSTILDLVLRFYDPKNGSVFIDNTNIKDVNLDDYRKLFGIVSQETILFNDTIKNNLKYGKTDASTDEINTSLETANAKNFIYNLPLNIDSIVGDRGASLSGGERQRVAIARALVRDPEILVFDEATSALDSESEKIVQEAINESLAGRTAIIVAHRLATIINADKIFVFDSGRVVESGSHAELIAKDGIYNKLYQIQFGSN